MYQVRGMSCGTACILGLPYFHKLAVRHRLAHAAGFVCFDSYAAAGVLNTVAWWLMNE
jgi:hypothetical protein